MQEGTHQVLKIVSLAAVNQKNRYLQLFDQRLIRTSSLEKNQKFFSWFKIRESSYNVDQRSEIWYCSLQNNSKFFVCLSGQLPEEQQTRKEESFRLVDVVKECRVVLQDVVKDKTYFQISDRWYARCDGEGIISMTPPPLLTSLQGDDL